MGRKDDEKGGGPNLLVIGLVFGLFLPCVAFFFIGVCCLAGRSTQPTAPPTPSGEEEKGSTPVPPPGESLSICISEAGSFARTEAIAQWMNDNPSLAADFSPDDVVLALSAIYFSLDLPLAATEIASGVTEAGGSITCDHVVKAVCSCSESVRLDIVRCMLPFLSDSVNEERILGLFSSFERELIDRALKV